MKYGYALIGAAIGLFAHISSAQAQTCNVWNLNASPCFNTLDGSGMADGCIVAGGFYNSVGMDAQNSVIAGGYNNDIGNSVQSGVIGGGKQNVIYYNATYGAISGGYDNGILPYVNYGFVGGGRWNLIQSNSASGTGADYSTIVGGYHNIINMNNDYSVIVGGYQNSTAATYAFIGGGSSNVASGSYSMVAGGLSNNATGTYSAILGGASNDATGYGSTVAGGVDNQASGMYSFAAGFGAKADQNSCFVWADNTGWYQDCTMYPPGLPSHSQTNAFIVRATGGVEFITSVNPSTGAPTGGMVLIPGSGTWSNLSDRNQKHDFRNVDPAEVLRRVVAMPITTWKYNSEVTGATHMGPMAQDFYAAFGLGSDERHITSIDEEGVALAAIQGLYQEGLRKDGAINALSDRVAGLEKVNAEMGDRALKAEKANASLERAVAEANARAASLEQRLLQIEMQMGIRK